MKTQKWSHLKRIRYDGRGQQGCSEIRRVTPVIDLNWQRMNERRETRKPYYSPTVGEVAVIVMDAYPNLGGIFGDRILVRGSPEYHY